MEMMYEEGLKELENGMREKSSDELLKSATTVTNPNSNANSNNNSPTAPSTVLASPADKNKKTGEKQVENGGGVLGDSEVHVFTERERRKKMRTMFSTLHSLLPHLPPKADKSTTVDEAIKYIDILEKNLQQLQKQRLNKRCKNRVTELGPSPLSMPQPEIKTCFQTWFSPNVVINMCGNDAQISVCSTKRPVGFLTNIFYILNKHKIDILSAHISSKHYCTMYMIHAHHAGGGAPDQFSEGFSVEETFKLAVGEVIFCLFSSN